MFRNSSIIAVGSAFVSDFSSKCGGIIDFGVASGCAIAVNMLFFCKHIECSCA